MLRIVFVLHTPEGCSGQIGRIFKARGAKITTVCPLAGDRLPPLNDFDAAIVFGGKMSANDYERLPALEDEMAWICDVTHSGKAFLGICLGAQLLAMSFGGQVTRHPEYVVEIGYYPVYPTLAGYETIFQQMPARFFQWHNEGFTLPENAIKLAASDLFPNQAFQIGDNAFGFQFHPEATAEQIQIWHSRDHKELHNPGAQTVKAQLAYRDRLSDEIYHWLENFLDYWLVKGKR